MNLVLKAEDAQIAQSLSALVKVGDDLWIGGDEGVNVFRMVKSPDGADFVHGSEVNLVETFQLPHLKAKDAASEVDLEGMDWDEKNSYLWLIASHSRKRKQAKPTQSKEDNLRDLGKLSYDPHRFLLGRLALKVDNGVSSALAPGSYSGGHFPARLDCKAVGKDQEEEDQATSADGISHSELSKALWNDPLLGPFMQAKTPGKDNGLDIEGLAWEGQGERLLVGLRGPVLRGMAVLLEMQFDETFTGNATVGMLRMKPAKDGSLYRRHFLDLGGLSIRDLCFHGDDLLILAGPNIPAPWPATIYRWKGARAALNKGEEDFHWRMPKKTEDQKEMEAVKISPEIEPYLAGTLPQAIDEGNPEGLTIWKDRLLLLRDSPSGSHLPGESTVLVDEVALTQAIV
ncbi:DUF3616 domain-containing protein [Haloferula sp. BvORR071]|uniref:DUF3616 domain-containing protein n=1 Tax=Haloferula sp. BvORR071 TaxID=1396141 RepID=UPI000554A11F|nr:DUF3616 domain-containing protein [Haloferula sp. BvORR071]